MPLAAYLRGLIEEDLGMHPSGELNDLNDRPNLNTGDAWSESEEYDIAYGAKHGDSLEELAELLCRTKREIAEKARAMGYENIPMWRNRRMRGSSG